MPPGFLNRRPDIVLLGARALNLLLRFGQLHLKRLNGLLAFNNILIRLLNFSNQRRPVCVFGITAKRFQINPVLLVTLLQFVEDLLEISDPALLHLCRLTGLTCTLVKGVPALGPYLHRFVCTRQSGRCSFSRGPLLPNRWLAALELVLPHPELLLIRHEVLASLIERSAGLF